MNKEKFLINQICNFCELLHITYPQIKRDNRLGGYSACVSFIKYQKNSQPLYKFRYHGGRIKNCSKLEIINLVLHELGHIQDKDYYSREESEYRAERFALDNIKKYYPKYYKRAVNNLKEYQHARPPYGKIFLQLYRERKNEI